MADCPEFFIRGVEPQLINNKLHSKTKMLCYQEFGLLYSGVTRTPLWSAEHLTRENLTIGVGVGRPAGNAFHEEKSLSVEDRATLNDYKGSGYDRGHMSPNGDMSSFKAREETFTLANMVPQAPCNNEVIWEGIESAVRTLVKNEGEAFIVTGPVFKGDQLQSLHGRIVVPTHIFKAVYVPSTNEAFAYLTPNDNSLKWEIISVTELKELVGIDVFPELNENIKWMRGEGPAPEKAKYNCRIH